MTCRHLENNQLTGPLPSYLGSLSSLEALYVTILVDQSYTPEISGKYETFQCITSQCLLIMQHLRNSDRFIQNNSFNGEIPAGLVSRKIIFK